MGFTVQPQYLRQYADVLGKQGEHADHSATFCVKYVTIEDMDQGLINRLSDTHEQIHTQLQQSFTTLSGIGLTTKAELIRTAGVYERTNAEAAARFDHGYPGVDRPVRIGPTGPIREVMDPSGRLTEPGAPQEFQNPTGLINTIGNAVSPGYWVNEVLNVLLGVNPKDEATKYFAGDWEKFAKCAGAFNAVGCMFGDVRDNVTANLNTLQYHWGGHAAAGADTYFRALGSSLNTYSGTLIQLRDTYLKQARGVWQCAQAVSDILQDIFDAAFWAVVEVSAGWVLSETVIGTAVLWAVAALECQRIVSGWAQIQKLLATTTEATNAVVGEITRLMNEGQLKVEPLPCNYSSPVR